MVQVLVVKSYDAITRLRSIAQQAKVPIPAMLADSLIQVGGNSHKTRGQKGGETKSEAT